MLDFIFNNLWYILIGLCLIASLAHPSMQSKVCGVVFCAVAIAPELTNVKGLHYFPLCMILALLGIIIIHGLQPYSKFSFNICCLLLAEITMNIVGMCLWFFEVSSDISMVLYQYSAYEISPLFLYENAFLVYYFIAAVVLFDWRNRKDAINSGVFQFIGDFVFSPLLRFKGSYRWKA
jgi:hypothetical protein